MPDPIAKVDGKAYGKREQRNERVGGDDRPTGGLPRRGTPRPQHLERQHKAPDEISQGHCPPSTAVKLLTSCLPAQRNRRKVSEDVELLPTTRWPQSTRETLFHFPGWDFKLVLCLHWLSSSAFSKQPTRLKETVNGKGRSVTGQRPVLTQHPGLAASAAMLQTTGPPRDWEHMAK